MGYCTEKLLEKKSDGATGNRTMGLLTDGSVCQPLHYFDHDDFSVLTSRMKLLFYRIQARKEPVDGRHTYIYISPIWNGMFPEALHCQTVRFWHNISTEFYIL